MQSCMVRSDRLMGVYRGRFAKDPPQFKRFVQLSQSSISLVLGTHQGFQSAHLDLGISMILN